MPSSPVLASMCFQDQAPFLYVWIQALTRAPPIGSLVSASLAQSSSFSCAALATIVLEPISTISRAACLPRRASST